MQLWGSRFNISLGLREEKRSLKKIPSPSFTETAKAGDAAGEKEEPKGLPAYPQEEKKRRSGERRIPQRMFRLPPAGRAGEQEALRKKAEQTLRGLKLQTETS